MGSVTHFLHLGKTYEVRLKESGSEWKQILATLWTDTALTLVSRTVDPELKQKIQEAQERLTQDRTQDYS